MTQMQLSSSSSFASAHVDTYIGAFKTEVADPLLRVVSPIYMTRYLITGTTPAGVLTIRLIVHELVWEPNQLVTLPNMTPIHVLEDWELKSFLRANRGRLRPILREYPKLAEKIGLHL